MTDRPELTSAMQALALRDKIANALNECECGHFVNEHGGDGCLASSDEVTGNWSDAESDWLCACMMSPRAIQEANVAVMVADAAHEAEARGYDAGCVAEAAAWKPERDALAKELADLRGAVEAGKRGRRRVDLMLPGDSYTVETITIDVTDLRALLNASSNP